MSEAPRVDSPGVAVVGGGITGLTAAFRLKAANVPVTVYEASGRVGGVIRSIRDQGYLAEAGPNTILETTPAIGELVRDLDLVKRRLDPDERSDRRYLVRNRKPILLPGSPFVFFTSPLFSWRAKLRLLREPFIGRGEKEEESVAEFVRRRLGQEFLDYAVDPLVAGIYAGDPARLSVRHAFPRLHALEQKYGSLIRGQIFGARERAKHKEVSKQSAPKLSFDEGLQVLTDTLAARLGESIKLNCPISAIHRHAGGWQLATSGSLDQPVHAAVVYAGPAHAVPSLGIGEGSAPLHEIRHPPVASVVLGFKREQVAHALDGFGMLIPKVEGFGILGTIFSSTLFPNRAPAGHVLLTSYVGGERKPALALRPESELIELVCKDLRTLLGASGNPTFTSVTVFSKAIPQYEVGYGRFKEWISSTEAKCPGLFFAGNYCDGISLSDAIRSGVSAAQRVTSHWLAR